MFAFHICIYYGIFIDTFNVSGKTPNRQAFASESYFLPTQEIERVMSTHRFLEQVTFQGAKYTLNLQSLVVD